MLTLPVSLEINDEVLLDYQQKAKRTLTNRRQRTIADRVDNMIHGLCGEVGEIQNKFKKMIHHGKDWDRDVLADELGDACWYWACMCEVLDMKVTELFENPRNPQWENAPDPVDLISGTLIRLQWFSAQTGVTFIVIRQARPEDQWVIPFRNNWRTLGLEIFRMIANLADALGLSMKRVFEMNVDKLEARYPDGFKTEQAPEV